MPSRPPFATYARKTRAETQREYAVRRMSAPELAQAAQIRSSAGWQAVRRRFLAAHPVCGCCGQRLADQVHHLEPVERRPDLALAWDNLAPVCTGCHARCNGLERAGKQTAQLFAGFIRQPQFGGLD